MSTVKNSTEIVRRIVDRLVSEYRPEKIVLFGSYAQGNPTDESDIDLLIVKETTGSFYQRWVAVRRILLGLHGSTPLDTLVVTPKELEVQLRRGNQFLADILRHGEVLYAAR